MKTNTAKVTIEEIKITGLFKYANTYKKLIEMLRESKIFLKFFISKKFPLEDVKEAPEYPEKNPEGT